MKPKFVVLPLRDFMLKKLIILVLVCGLPGCAIAQFSAEHAAMNSLKKGKWEKARGQLRKAIKKDSINVEAHYALTQYFFTPANPAFQIDSAYLYIMKAISDFEVVPSKQRDRLKKIPLDSALLVKLRERIDSAAFERAKSKNTEASYIDFLARFPLASQQVQAVGLRNEVAYQNVLTENTYEAFLRYLEKYPESVRAAEAKANYDLLLFESKIKDKKLASYEAFLRDFPETPYRNEVEKQIFEISTASGESADFEKFLKKYPQSAQVRRARNILYHLLKDEGVTIPAFLINDSLTRLQQLEKYFLIPVLKSENFGFINELGEEVMKPTYGEILDDYLCGNITDEFLVLDNKVVARNGSVIYTGKINEIESLGYGFIRIATSDCIKIVHASGFNLGDCLQDASVVGKNYVALKRDKRWALLTFAGRTLIDFEWDDIQQIGDVVCFKKAGKTKLIKLKDLARLADRESATFTQEYDEVKLWSGGMIWVRAGKEQGVLNSNLKEWIKLSVQEITPAFFGAVSHSSLGYKLYDKASAPSQNFIHVNMNKPWVGVQQEGYWKMIDPVTKQFWSPAFDSIMFRGPFLMGLKNDTLQVYLSRENFMKLQATTVQFLPGKDSVFFLMVEEKDKKTIYDAKGKQLFSTAFEKIEYNNEGYFTVIKKDKRGLVHLNGKLILQPEYDALGTVSKGVVQVLKDKKFGFIDLAHRKQIKPEYVKNVVPYNSSYNVVFKNGFCGLVDWANKPFTGFEYEEIRYWNDSAALVKKNFNWMIYNFVNAKVSMDKIKNFKKVFDSDEEKIMIVQQENNFGVISNKNGTIIPATFSDIVNVGSATVPVYFTEKHVEEASIFVVIYYNENGVQLRKQVYEAEDYEKIYCSGN